MSITYATIYQTFDDETSSYELAGDNGIATLDADGNVPADQLGNVVYPPSPAVSAPDLVSGDAIQDATGTTSTWLVAFTGGAGGTYSVAIGDDDTTADAIFTSVPLSINTSDPTVSIPLPAHWWIKVTAGGSASIASCSVVNR